MSRQTVTGIVKMEVDGTFGEEELNHLTQELDWAVASLWDGDTVLPTDNENTLLSYQGVNVVSGNPKAVAHYGEDGFSLLTSEMPLDLMLINSNHPNLEDIVKREAAEELQLMPVDVFEFDTPQGQFGTFEIHSSPADENEETAEYFEFGQDREMLTSYAASVKRYLDKDGI